MYAMDSLALLLETGAEGVRSNPILSVELYKRAIEDGSIPDLIETAKKRLDILQPSLPSGEESTTDAADSAS